MATRRKSQSLARAKAKIAKPNYLSVLMFNNVSNGQSPKGENANGIT